VIIVTNDTCAEFYVYVFAMAGTPDAGAAVDSSSPDAGSD
jgi:hypothetical protein